MALGRILVNGKFVGIGFALATSPGEPSQVALTANHVVSGQTSSDLRFENEDGRLIGVESVDPDEVGDLDVAVLHLREEVPDALKVSHAVEGAAWKTQATRKPTAQNYTELSRQRAAHIPTSRSKRPT